MTNPRPDSMTTTHRNFAPEPGRTRVTKGRGMSEGLVYVEAYLPFDPDAFAEWQTALKAAGGNIEATAAAHPELASKALEPVDYHGEAMLQGDLIDLAHQYISICRKMDIQHDQAADRGVEVVQTFVNTPEIDSPNFWPGAWVVALKLAPGSEAWERVEKGELDAVSFEALVSKLPVIVTTNPE